MKRHGLKHQQWLHELFNIQLSVWSFEYRVPETCLTFSCAVPWQTTAMHVWYLLFSENNHHYIITIKCLGFSNQRTSALFKHHCWQELRVAIGSSQNWKHLPPLHRNITKLCVFVCVCACACACVCVCVCACDRVLLYSVLCYLVSAPQSPLPSTPAWDAFLCLFSSKHTPPQHQFSICLPHLFNTDVHKHANACIKEQQNTQESD